MKLQTTSNNVLVKVQTKMIKHFGKIMAIAAANNLPANPADCVSITGEVVAIPKKITQDHWHTGFTTDDIKVGDTAIFSHQVINDLDDTYKDIPVYKNRIEIKAEEYFLADIPHIFGVIRNGEIIMVNGWVMLTTFTESKIVLPQSMKRLRHATKAEIMHIGKPRTNMTPINAKQGDTVYFNPFIAQKYEINDKPFTILPQEKILGKDV